MTRGIIVFGASGSGTTTIGKRLARELNCRHFEADDYLWENTAIPYTIMRTVDERSRLLQQDLNLAFMDTSTLVLSGSLFGWDPNLMQAFNLAIFVLAPTEVRLRRLRERESAKWGTRIMPGGDMHENHLSFLEWASVYDTGGLDIKSRALHEAWSEDLPCPVLRIDGTQQLEATIESILSRLKENTELPLT